MRKFACSILPLWFFLCESFPQTIQNPTENSLQQAGAVSGAAVNPSLNQDRALIPGDQISISVLEDANAGLPITPITLTVQSDGTISLPIQGPKGYEYTLPPIKAQGLTPKELQKKIKEILEQEYYQVATVSLNLISFGGSIEIMGEVGSPGTYNLPPDRRLTLTAAIARAGGFTQFANQRKVELRRKLPDGTVEKKIIDVKEIQKTGKGNIELQHGDEINVRAVGLFTN